MKHLSHLIFAVTAFAGLSVTSSAATIEVGSATVNTISQDTRWTRDNVYVLTRVVYVVPPARLTIEPGTIVRGVPGFSAGAPFGTGGSQEPGTLVISRGAKIIANGTADDPITFTAIGDPDVPGGAATIPATINGQSTAAYVAGKNFAPDGPTGNNAFAQEKECGGVILLGLSPIGFDADADANFLHYDPVTNTYADDGIKYPTGPSALPAANDIKGGNGVGIALVEGLVLTPIDLATLTPPGSFTEPFPNASFDAAQSTPGSGGRPGATSIIGGVYGGLNRDDNSGVLRFCSHRYGGFVIGTDNEINGFTFGGVGRGTVVEWLESMNNADDGFEWFGGFVNCRYLFSLYQGDDGFDGDQGYNGNMQFLFNITDNLAEIRSGWASNNTSTGRLAADAGDRLAEWDGSEDNGVGVTPNTDQYMRNLTLVHAASVTSRDGIFTRRAGNGRWFNAIVQDVGKLNAAAREDNSQGATSVQKDRIIFARCNGASSPGTNAITTASSEIIGAGHTAFQGLDPRLTSTANGAALTFSIPTKRVDAYPFSGATPVSYAGCMRDNDMLSGWSVLDYLQILAPGNVARPAVTLSASAGNATVTWAAAAGQGGRAVVYVVERSTDRRTWTPIAVVQDNVTGLNDAAIVAEYGANQFVTTDGNATAGSITVTDSVSGALVAGTPRYYRVIPQ